MSKRACASSAMRATTTSIATRRTWRSSTPWSRPPRDGSPPLGDGTSPLRSWWRPELRGTSTARQQQSLIGPLELSNRALGKPLLHDLPGAFAHALSQHRVVDEHRRVMRQRSEVLALDQESVFAVLNDL